MVNPISKKLFEVIDNYAASYFAGECSYEDAIDLAYGELIEYTESEAYKQALQEYFDKFVDVKTIGEEEIVWNT